MISRTACITRRATFEIVERVVELAGRLGHSPAQIALAWLLHQPDVTAPIIGASKMQHLEDAGGSPGDPS